MEPRGAAPILALIVLGLIAGPHSARAATYANVRFAYSISYPADLLIPEREADNGDGRAFHARKGTAKMTVWGSYRNEDLEATPDAILREYNVDCGASVMTYKVVKSGLIAFSCVTTAGRIIYQKTILNGDVLRSVRFDYPYSDRAVWDQVVSRVSGSLRAGTFINPVTSDAASSPGIITAQTRSSGDSLRDVCPLATMANDPCLVHSRSLHMKSHPQDAWNAECMGLKVFEDPQPPGHPMPLAECDRRTRQDQVALGLAPTGMSEEQKNAYRRIWGNH